MCRSAITQSAVLGPSPVVECLRTFLFHCFSCHPQAQLIVSQTGRTAHPASQEKILYNLILTILNCQQQIQIKPVLLHTVGTGHFRSRVDRHSMFTGGWGKLHLSFHKNFLLAWILIQHLIASLYLCLMYNI